MVKIKDFWKRLTRFWPVTPFIYALLGLIVLIDIFAFTLHERSKLILVCITLTFFAFACTFLLEGYVRSTVMKYLQKLSGALSHDELGTVESVPLPALTVRESGEIVWYNSMFSSELMSGGDALGTDIVNVLPKIGEDSLRDGETFELRHGKKWYLCSCTGMEVEDEGEYMVTFTDITSLKATEALFRDTRPGVIEIMFDNEEELLKERESERMHIMSEIDSLINSWAAETHGICWANAREKSLLLVEFSDLEKLINDRFSILSKARQIQVKDGINATLSIGVGYGGRNLAECELWARNALEMALGRGGDQAAVRSPDGYAFYGGVTNSSERQSKVKMRMYATTLSEIIAGCENCFIMGHARADLDAFGAAAGMLSLVRSMDKEAYIVVDRTVSPASGLIDWYEKNSGFDKCITEPSDALDRVHDGSLVIVVDTHSKNNTECPALLSRASSVVVIDHHRMMVDYITGAKLFIQESYASSACELVTELIGYLNEKVIRRAEAEAMLSGIMLDTRNFVLRTGMRTFEAAAVLRRRGADTLEAKKYLDCSMDTFVARSSIISTMFIKNNCAFALVHEQGPVINVAAPQAADEMSSVTGVDAAFVLYPNAGKIFICARSLGRLNVQLVMEQLGGGGHLTMAGAQIPDVTVETALDMLQTAVSAQQRNTN